MSRCPEPVWRMSSIWVASSKASQPTFWLLHVATDTKKLHGFAMFRCLLLPQLKGKQLTILLERGLECMAVDRLELYHHRFNFMRRDAAPENAEETKADQTVLCALGKHFGMVQHVSS